MSKKRVARFILAVEYDEDVVDATTLEVVLNNLLDTALSTPGVLEE
jgi:hypothetical protein